MRVLSLYAISIIAIMIDVSNSKYNNLTYNTDYQNYPIGDDFFHILDNITDFIHNVSNITFEIYSECFNTIFEDLVLNQHNLIKYLINSGKTILDLGLEKECKELENIYMLLIYSIKKEEDALISYFADVEVYEFINQNNFYTGICYPPQCIQWVSDFLNPKINERFFQTYVNSTQSSIESIYHIDDMILNESPRHVGFYVLVCILVCGLCVQLFGSVLEYLGLAVNELSIISNDSIRSNENESINESSLLDNTDMVIFTQITHDFSNQNQNNTCSYIASNLSILRNFALLVMKKNIYFNEFNLEWFSFIRTILMFLMIFNQNIETIIQIPSKDFANRDFYRSFLFTFVTISSYSVDLWVTLDGMVMVYKLMWYIKQNVYDNNKVLGFEHFFKFYLLSLSKLLTFLILFFLLHFYSDIFVYYISGGGGLFKYYESLRFHFNKMSIAYYHLIPFYTIFNYDEMIGSYEAMPFIVIYIHEFYVFTFLILVFYIGMKAKSKLFDLSIITLILVNIGLTFFSVHKDEINQKSKITFQILIDNHFIGKYPHLLLNHYFIGMIGGMTIFYYQDAISNKPTSLGFSSSYLPFFYTHTFNNFLFSLSSALKLTLIFFIIFLELLIGMIFSIKVNLTNTLNMKISLMFRILYSYRPIIVSFLFMILVTLIIMNQSNNGVIKRLISVKIFRLFSRVSMASFCSFDIIIYAFYCLFNFQLKLCYENMFMVSIGLFLFIEVFSIVFSLSIELPLRRLVKYILFRKEQSVEASLMPIVM